jgi:hypothetical protein
MPDKKLDEVIAERVAAELAARDKEANRKKDPASMADLIDRISDVTVEKLFAKLAEGEEEEEHGGEEVAPLSEHPFFKPLSAFGKRDKSA